MARAHIWSALVLLGLAFGWNSPMPLVWAALVAPCAGWYLGCQPQGRRRAFTIFQGALAVVCGLAMVGEAPAAGVLWAWCALAGLSAVPYGLGERFGGPGSAHRGAVQFGILGLLLAVLPTGAGLLDTGWAKRSPQLAGLAMDAAPTVFVLECAGLDVFRMDMFYESETTDFVMGIRRPWDTPLAPLVVGSGLVALPRQQPSAST